MFYFLGVLAFLFGMGIAIYVIRNVHEIAKSTYHASGDAFNLNFWLRAYWFVIICAIAFSIFSLYGIFSTLFFS